MQCDGVLLGREPVDGTVNASTLASLVRTLTASRDRISRGGTMFGERRYTLRCRDGLELLPASKTPPHSSGGRPRRLDDEGFESDADDDTASTRSVTSTDDTVSNSSSCCFVDDHVFKFPTASPTSSRGVAISSSSSVATDSANSSGASDTDDVDTSGAPSPSAGSVSKLVQSLSLYHRSPPPSAGDTTEFYSVTDIAFCHTDPSFPKVVVWVVKKKRLARLTCTGAENAKSGLEAIVFECPNERGLRKLCGSFQELSRRVKLEQYRHPHRRKDTPCTGTITTTTLKPSNITFTLSTPSASLSSTNKQNTTTGNLPLNRASIGTAQAHSYTSKITDNTKSYSNSTSYKTEIIESTKSCVTSVAKAVDVVSYAPTTNQKTAESSSFNVPQPKSVPKAVRPSVMSSTSKDEIGNIQLTSVSKFNLVQRTDGDGMTHIEVSRGLVQEGHHQHHHVPVETITESEAPSSIISISTPDVGNLLLSSSPHKSRLCKEIEGVIRTDVDSAHARREVPTRQRQPAILVMNGEDSGGELRKVWTPPEEDHNDEDDVVMADAPQRPERRRYVRKKTPAPPPPVIAAKKVHPQSRHQPEVVVSQRNTGNQQRVVRGQFIRVSVDQPPSPGSPSQPTVVVPMVATPPPWVYSNGNGAPKMVAYSPTPSWGISLSSPLKTSSSNRETGKNQRKGLEDVFCGQQKQHRRSRSSGGTSRSPPVARRPMAYRYIDVSPSNNTLSNRFFGLSQKLREMSGGGSGNQGGCPYATTGRRRGSGGEDHERYAHHGGPIGGQGHLKSVIKKGGGRRSGEYGEPKKVTFSAYATVQVVD